MVELAVSVLGIILCIVVYIVRDSYYRSKVPSDDILHGYIDELKKMRNKSAKYQDKITFLREKGIPKNVAEKLIALSEEEST